MAFEYLSPRTDISTTFLGILCQHLVTLTVKKFFLMFRQSLPCSSLCPLSLVLSLGTTRKYLAPSLRPAFGYYMHWQDLPRAFSSPVWTVTALSAFPHSTGAPVPWLSSWPFAELSRGTPSLCDTGEPRPGHSTTGVASPVLRSREGSPLSTCWQCSSSCSPGYCKPSLLQGPTLELTCHKVLTGRTLILLCYHSSESSRWYIIQTDHRIERFMTTVLCIALNHPKQPFPSFCE